jgi:hypothetical protein
MASWPTQERRVCFSCYFFRRNTSKNTVVGFTSRPIFKCIRKILWAERLTIVPTYASSCPASATPNNNNGHGTPTASSSAQKNYDPSVMVFPLTGTPAPTYENSHFSTFDALVYQGHPTRMKHLPMLKGNAGHLAISSLASNARWLMPTRGLSAIGCVAVGSRGAQGICSSGMFLFCFIFGNLASFELFLTRLGQRYLEPTFQCHRRPSCQDRLPRCTQVLAQYMLGF